MLTTARRDLIAAESVLTVAGSDLTVARGKLTMSGKTLTLAGTRLTMDCLARSTLHAQICSMNTAQDNRVTMFKTVDAFLHEKDAVWNGMAAMVSAHQELEDGIKAVDASAEKQETPVTGAAADKGASRSDLEDTLFLVAEALGVLGHDAKDNELLALVNVNLSSLHTMGDEALANRASLIQKEATDRAADLAPLNVTAANLTELQTRLDAFNAGKFKPRTAVADRSAQTSALPDLIREVSGLLRGKMDRLVNLFRRSDPDFVAGYRTARVIVDRGGGQAAKKPTPTPPKP